MSLLLSMSRHLAGERWPVCPRVTPAWRSLWFSGIRVTPAWRSLWFTGIRITGPASCPRSTTIPLLIFTIFLQLSIVLLIAVPYCWFRLFGKVCCGVVVHAGTRCPPPLRSPAVPNLPCGLGPRESPSPTACGCWCPFSFRLLVGTSVIALLPWSVSFPNRRS